MDNCTCKPLIGLNGELGHAVDCKATDIDRQIDEFIDDIRYNTEIPFDDRLTSAKASLKFLLSQAAVAALEKQRKEVLTETKNIDELRSKIKTLMESFAADAVRASKTQLGFAYNTQIDDMTLLLAMEIKSLQTPPQGGNEQS